MIHLKSAATLFSEHTAIGTSSGISKEILCIIAAEGAAKLWEVRRRILDNSHFTDVTFLSEDREQ